MSWADELSWISRNVLRNAGVRSPRVIEMIRITTKSSRRVNPGLLP
jgi:hypothetical protein